MNDIRIPESIKMFSSRLLAEAALERGIKLNHINDYQEENAFIELRFKKHREYIQGSKSSQTSVTADRILENKMLTKDFLREKGICPTEGKLFLCGDTEDIRNFCEKITYPVVVKKFNGTHGDLVFVGMKNFAEVANVLKKYFSKEKYVLIEKEFKGREFRFIATRKKVLAVTFREPANIVGDGKSSVKELIVKKNEDPQRGLNYSKPLITIEVDDRVRAKLKIQKIDINSIITRGEKVYLRNNSNLSTGGDSVDFTDKVHPYFKKIAVKAVSAIPGLSYAGVDIMVKGDISQKPKDFSYAVLEMNPSPGIFMHHFPYEGRPRPVAEDIIDLLFPETKK